LLPGDQPEHSGSREIHAVTAAASTRITLANPAGVLKPLCEHLVEHEAVITQQDGTTTIALDGSRARIELSANALDVHVEAPDVATLLGMKRAIAGHVIEFAPKGAAPELRWIGDGTGPALPPEFRILTVTGVERITPHMARIPSKATISPATIRSTRCMCACSSRPKV